MNYICIKIGGKLMEKYDSFGRLNSEPWEDIKKGDLVEYGYKKNIQDEFGRTKQIKVYLNGIWDGEKVCFNDKEQYVVRTTRWLKKNKLKKL